jgi:hypothetical protein
LTIVRFTALTAAALTAAALAVVAVLPRVVDAALVSSAEYAGATGDGHRVTLRLQRSTTRLNMRIEYAITCNGGRSFDTYTRIMNLPVRSDGSFRGSGTYQGSADSSHNQFKVSGRLHTDSASGVFSLSATGADGMRCHTGHVHFDASRTSGRIRTLRLNLVVVPGPVTGSGVRLDDIRVQRKGHGGPSPRGAQIFVRCSRGCRSRTLRMSNGRQHISYLKGHTLPRGSRFFVRVIRSRPAARGPQWKVSVSSSGYISVTHPALVAP